MTRERCPGCGAPYNGKKCRACFFQPVETDISHGNRKEKHKLPLSGKQKRQPSVIRAMVGFLIILLLIALLLPAVREFGENLETIEASHSISANP